MRPNKYLTIKDQLLTKIEDFNQNFVDGIVTERKFNKAQPYEVHRNQFFFDKRPHHI